MEQAGLPKKDMAFVTMQVVEWDGPIVEIVFRRALATTADVEQLLEEARMFMDTYLPAARRDKAYFITCYDHFSVSRDQAHRLQEAFLDFNRVYSRGDVRYGGTLVAQTLVISTSIKSESASEIHPTRDQALERLRARIQKR